MSIERLIQQESDDVKVMVKTTIDSMLNDINDKHNDMDLGRKLRTYKRVLVKLTYQLDKL